VTIELHGLLKKQLKMSGSSLNIHGQSLYEFCKAACSLINFCKLHSEFVGSKKNREEQRDYNLDRSYVSSRSRSRGYSLDHYEEPMGHEFLKIGKERNNIKKHLY